MRTAILLLVLSLGAATVPASAATERDALVRPGRSIAKVGLGMTEAQVRRVAGRPFRVERTRLSNGYFQVEYDYDVESLDVELVGRRSLLGQPARRARVVRVATYSDEERLPNGIGVGTRERRLLKVFGARLDCPRWRTSRPTGPGIRAGEGLLVVSPFRACALPGPGNAETVFVSRIDVGYRGFGIATPKDIPKARVWQIIVQATG
jgi:hypothetical protein